MSMIFWRIIVRNGELYNVIPQKQGGHMIELKSVIRKYFKVFLKIIFAYALTGGLYLIFETAFRQYTFIEMFDLAGCVGLAAMFFNNIFSYNVDYLLQIFIVGSIYIFGEGFVGNWLNTDYHMWDYRTLPGSMWNDQINIIFYDDMVYPCSCYYPCTGLY